MTTANFGLAFFLFFLASTLLDVKPDKESKMKGWVLCLLLSLSDGQLRKEKNMPNAIQYAGKNKKMRTRKLEES